jgi:predicted GNAT superfamily acetyltransferase
MQLAYRDLTTLDDFAAVVNLERTIWGPGYDEVVPVPILAVSVLRGGVLIGAFDGSRMVGFVYSQAGLKNGNPTQWSHMLGVLDEYRNGGMGHHLKMLQRERALAMGLDLIEWTFDPLQALNAHLNFKKLGVVVEEYEENVYGTSNSPLHAGNPTDRFVAEWWIQKDRTQHDWSRAAAANRIEQHGGWPRCIETPAGADARAVTVTIPMGFTAMLANAPDEAMRWRLATRKIFTDLFHRRYRAVDFELDRAAKRGTYLLRQG